jgi:hypothetical protein
MSLNRGLNDPRRRHGHWGSREPGIFKLQWICPNRNIDCARKVSATRAGGGAGSCLLLGSRRILLK